MSNVSGDRPEILAKIYYSLVVTLPEILPLELFIWGMYHNSDTEKRKPSTYSSED